MVSSFKSFEGDTAVVGDSKKFGLKSVTGTLGRRDSKMSLPTLTLARGLKNDFSSNFGIGSGNVVDDNSGEVEIVIGVDGVGEPKDLTAGAGLKFVLKVVINFWCRLYKTATNVESD
jgi:hypothetical protein